ncbi:hypothetical protein SmphiM12_378 [Sinorhizobium phage phiM12]|uniref:Uncharacterized protein n=1 Tax=Sinorhizobium phage phiM12 TaxID=1357423 RepID=S5MQA2_9CAUD|nr:hypothetical protein AB690_gp218 [Sinorhizobium phage phiM12]AGR48010.1 hypothetical protein SmphiM12_378 [Sinorhizobium phage phiM12]AKF13196.1 hypothetical protein PHIM19_291 [Sinorhizobium phage phiM19]
MSKPRTVATLNDSASVIFRVETNYPGSNPDDFGSVAAYAFIHNSSVDEMNNRVACREHMTIWTHREVFRDYTVASSESIYTGYVTETMDFHNPEDAFRVARFIRDECQLMSGYEHGTEWEKNHRGPIKTRVVMISSRKTIHEVVEA